jgi:hypothetical protein
VFLLRIARPRAQPWVRDRSAACSMSVFAVPGSGATLLALGATISIPP